MKRAIAAAALIMLSSPVYAQSILETDYIVPREFPPYENSIFTQSSLARALSTPLFTLNLRTFEPESLPPLRFSLDVGSFLEEDEQEERIPRYSPIERRDYTTEEDIAYQTMNFTEAMDFFGKKAIEAAVGLAGSLTVEYLGLDRRVDNLERRMDPYVPGKSFSITSSGFRVNFTQDYINVDIGKNLSVAYNTNRFSVKFEADLDGFDYVGLQFRVQLN